MKKSSTLSRQDIENIEKDMVAAAEDLERVDPALVLKLTNEIRRLHNWGGVTKVQIPEPLKPVEFDFSDLENED